MKRLLTALALSLACIVSFGATTTPVQLLNPTGSTAGQAVLSTGPTSAPAWGTVALSGVSGTLAIANGGTGSTTASAARTALGLGTAATVNTGTSGATIPLLNGANTWAAAQTFSIRPTFNGATPWDSSNLVFATPPAIGGTTPAAGAFTTLSASSTVSGTGFSTYFASPPAIGGTAAAAGSFTTLGATGLISPSSTSGIKGTVTNDNANAGSFGEYVTNTTTGTSLTTAVAANATSQSLTAGDWDVQCSGKFTSGASTTIASLAIGSSTTSATFAGVGTETLLTLPFTTGGGNYINGPVTRYSLASTTTVYCVGFSSFGVSTMTVDGLLRARRIR